MLIVTPVRHLERVAVLTDAELADVRYTPPAPHLTSFFPSST